MLIKYMRRDGEAIPARLRGSTVSRRGDRMYVIELFNEDGSPQKRRSVCFSRIEHYKDGSCTPEWLRLMNEMEHEE